MQNKKDDWFFEKVNGKQFHGKYSKCDDFCVRLQIRKRAGMTWSEVIRKIKSADYESIFSNSQTCTKDETRLVASYRIREKPNSHRFCSWGQKKKCDNWHIPERELKSIIKYTRSKGV